MRPLPLIFLLLPAACGREPEPASPPAVMIKKRPQEPPPAVAIETLKPVVVRPAPAPPPVPPPPHPHPSAPLPETPKPKPAFVPPPLKPSTGQLSPLSASFTFRTMDHLKAYVLVNGERYSDTVCLWALSQTTEFDPKIAVPDWPPKGAAWVNHAIGRDEEGRKTSTIEFAIDGGLYDLDGQVRLKREVPHLEPGEQVLYVKAEIQGLRRQGALRLKLVGENGRVYRYTNFTPLQSMEDERAAMFGRAVWFEREREN